MPNVCLIPTGDRSGQANLIHHYSKIGFNVYLPLHGTGGLDWKKIATWPALLCRSLSDRDTRNIDKHGFERKENFVFLGRVLAGNYFGEDRFISEEDNGPLYEDRGTACELVDFETSSVKIDVFHTLRSSDTHFNKSRKFQNKFFPNAKWISSTIYSNHHLPGKFSPKNVCKMMPANYDQLYKDINNFDCYPGGFEFELLNVKTNTDANKRSGFASFNHNFKSRYPTDYALLNDINKKLSSDNISIPNYGGNIGGQGADTKYSDRGPTGNLPTLSIRQAARLTAGLKAVVVFKQADYGGGVIWYSLMANTPIVTHEKYLQATHADSLFRHDYNCVIINTPEEAARAFIRLERDPQYLQQLMNGMRETYDNLVNDSYWDTFRIFVDKALRK